MRNRLFILIGLLALCACGSRNSTKQPVHAIVTEEVLSFQTDTIDTTPAEADGEMTILKSDDGNVTVYGWERPHNGTMGSYGSRVEYKWKGKTLTQESLPNGAEEALMPTKLYTLGSGKYILYQYFREWSSQGYIEAAAYELTSNGLIPAALFETPDSLSCCINVEFNIPDWYFRAGKGEGYDWLYHFDKRKKVLYHPSSSDYNNFSDRYIPYKWNGKVMVPGEEVGNPLLHESLSGYLSLTSLFRTERNLVRIDEMPDGTFRYAAWGKHATMLDKPELVILGGSHSDEASEWVFKNDDYEYHYTGSELYVLKSRKEVARWAQL